MISATEEAAVREWVKVPNVVGLYRNTVSGRYYGVKKLHSKRYECSVRTTDRQIAERRLRNWIHDLEKVDRELERTTLRTLIQKFEAVNLGKSTKTRATNASIIRRLMRSWPGGIDVEVRNIRPSQLDEWLAAQEGRLKNTTFNRYAGLLREMFRHRRSRPNNRPVSIQSSEDAMEKTTGASSPYPDQMTSFEISLPPFDRSDLRIMRRLVPISSSSSAWLDSAKPKRHA